MEQMIADRRYFWGKDGKAGTPMRKLFKSEATRGMTAPSIWDDVGLNQHAAREIELLFGSKAYFETPKPEHLLKRIIEIATNPNDLVLDFYAGSGTTAAVAHKMGRRWIAVEQMDYINGLTDKRMKKVIEGEQGGISKAVEWQGGGSFVYAELAQSNSAFATRIEAAPNTAALQGIWADMQATGYLRPDMDTRAFDPDTFAALPVEDAKRLLMDCLDANHLYVNLNSLGDADYDISDEDMRATRSFYGIAP
jgi:adenine-specific DNA-methyltransferase